MPTTIPVVDRPPAFDRPLDRLADQVGGASRWFAWTVWALALVAVSSVVTELDGAAPSQILEAVGWIVGVGSIATIGALAVAMRRASVQGWLLLAFALCWSLALLAYALISHGRSNGLGLEPSHRLIAAGDVALVVGLHAILLLLLIVPTGRLLSGRWRLAAWLVAGSAVLWIVQSVMYAGRVVDLDAWLARGTWSSLSGIILSDGEQLLFDVGQPVAAVVLLVPVTATLVARVRSARGEERQQLKWVAVGGLGVVAWLVLWLPQTGGWLAQAQRLLPGLAFTWLAIGLGFAMFRYRLWDVDLVIRRSAVFAVLWTAIAASYLAVAAGLGLLAGATFPVEVAIALTVLVAALFQPARRGLERLADAWVFGRRDSPVDAIHALAERVVEAGPTDMGVALAAVAQRAVGLDWVEVAIDGSPAVSFGTPGGAPCTSLTIHWRDERFGTIRCRPRRGAELSADDLALLDALASQAALAISHARLASRILRAQEHERRRLERNIHDGAQQDLAALIAQLGLARSHMKGDAVIDETLGRAQRDVQRILGDLRELAQGIHPSVLRDAGLVAAIDDRCSRLPLPVDLRVAESVSGRRFSPDVEGAAYFFVTEALANALKHSGSPSVEVSLGVAHGYLLVSVADGGRGIDPADVADASGLTGLADRIRALGGTMRIDSGLRVGTRLEARLPVDVPNPAWS
jgi:signal transduction histidine kinase